MKTMNAKEFWARLDTLLKAKKITYISLASDCGIPSATLYNNRSRNRFPRIAEIVTIALYLETSLDWLLLGFDRNANISTSDLKAFQTYINAPKEVKDLVDKVLRGIT